MGERETRGIFNKEPEGRTRDWRPKDLRGSRSSFNLNLAVKQNR